MNRGGGTRGHREAGTGCAPTAAPHAPACRPGTLVVARADLVAEWVPATAGGDRP